MGETTYTTKWSRREDLSSQLILFQVSRIEHIGSLMTRGHGSVDDGDIWCLGVGRQVGDVDGDVRRSEHSSWQNKEEEGGEMHYEM